MSCWVIQLPNSLSHPGPCHLRRFDGILIVKRTLIYGYECLMAISVSSIFSHIMTVSFICGERPECDLEKTTDLLQADQYDTLYHMKLYQVHLAMGVNQTHNLNSDKL